MEFDDLLDDRTPLQDELTLNQPVRDNLKESAGWGKFIAIIGFVFLGLSVISMLFMFASISSLAQFGGLGGAFIFLYLILLAIFAIPVYHLYNFATKTQEALLRDNQSLLVGAFSSHKTVFKFYGILMIIVLALYTIVLVLSFLGL